MTELSIVEVLDRKGLLKVNSQSLGGMRCKIRNVEA